jgi:hypothetical protein
MPLTMRNGEATATPPGGEVGVFSRTLDLLEAARLRLPKP